MKTRKPRPGSLLKNMSWGTESATYLAMLGKCAAVPHGRRLARLVAGCSAFHQKWQSAAAKLPPSPRRAALLRRGLRDYQRRVGPQLALLLWDSLGKLDPAPLERLAKIVRRICEHTAERIHAMPTHEKMLRLARVMEAEARLDPGVEWPTTRRAFLKRLGVPEGVEHGNLGYYRRELKRLRIPFKPTKRGRPKLVTRKRANKVTS